jgi:hypothetical protein
MRVSSRVLRESGWSQSQNRRLDQYTPSASRWHWLKLFVLKLREPHFCAMRIDIFDGVQQLPVSGIDTDYGTEIADRGRARDGLAIVYLPLLRLEHCSDPDSLTLGE